MVFGLLVTSRGQISLSDISDDMDDLAHELHCFDLDTTEIHFGTYPQTFTVICDGEPEDVGNDTPTIICQGGKRILGDAFICKTSSEGLLEDLSWADIRELSQHIFPYEHERFGIRLTIQGAYRIGSDGRIEITI